MARKIISNHWGGLGDWLSISTLPEELTKQGHEVFLAEKSLFRNEEIKQLFLMNPFIKGVVDEEPNVGDVPGLTPGYQRQFEKNGHHIASWEVLHGVPPVNFLPKIYYQPTKLPDLEDVVVVDTTSITEKYNPDAVRAAVDHLKASDNFRGTRFLAVQFSKKLNAPENDRFHGGRHDSYITDVENVVAVPSLFRYCDLLASVGGFISLHSGCHALAAAVKHQHNPQLHNVCIIRESNLRHSAEKDLFLFKDVVYLPIAD